MAAPTSDPLELYRYRDGLYAVDLLTAALVHFDFFGWLEKNPGTRDEICAALRMATRPADVMLTLFAANQLVEKSDGVFRVTQTARDFLVPGSPWFMGPYYASLKDRPIARDYADVLRSGKPAGWGSFQGETDWHKAMESEQFARNFTAAMDCRGLYLAPALARQVDCTGRRHLLDIAGGSGIYACTMAAHHPHLRATVFEKSPVDRVALRAIADRGFDSRVKVAVGDMFAGEWPADCDMHLFSNVLHDWDEPEVRHLLKLSHRHLPAGGFLIIHDMHLNARKDGPLPVAQYSCLLMHSTQGRCYSLSEMEEWLTQIGFAHLRVSPTVADRSVLTASKV